MNTSTGRDAASRVRKRERFDNTEHGLFPVTQHTLKNASKRWRKSA